MIDRELADLPPELRWREWMRRIEAVLFAAASPTESAVDAAAAVPPLPLFAPPPLARLLLPPLPPDRSPYL